MSRINALFLFVLLLLATAVGLKHFTSSETPPKALPKEAVILSFGDSLTYGTGAAPGESYPARLEQRIGRTVINAGAPGELSAEGLARLAPFLERHQPALLILCHGGNDILRKKTDEELRSNLDAMVRLARGQNIDVILIAVPQFSLIGLDPHPVYEEIAETYGLPIETDILPDLLGDNRTKSDRIHPNAAGYEKMAEAVEKVLRKEYTLEE
ncbi:MAG: arylesterase [Campylobacterales bacterium]|nr:arylesterase [Campylobacterales bacterium]